MILATKYTIFAVISTAINLLFQFFTFAIYSGFLDLYIAIFVGTIAGLISKYILDKKFIFYYTTKDTKDDGKKFVLYSLMGIFTTIIFWGFEIGFDLVFDSEIAKYIGAVIGLAIGYLIKYRLDKKFVFRRSDESI